MTRRCTVRPDRRSSDSHVRFYDVAELNTYNIQQAWQEDKPLVVQGHRTTLDDPSWL